MVYRMLNSITSFLEKLLNYNKDNGVINYFSIDAIPDDLRIEVCVVKVVPIKSITCTLHVKNTDNDKKI